MFEHLFSFSGDEWENICLLEKLPKEMSLYIFGMLPRRAKLIKDLELRGAVQVLDRRAAAELGFSS